MGTIAFFVFLFFSGLLQWLVIDGIWEDAGIADRDPGSEVAPDEEKRSASQVVCSTSRKLAAK